MAVVTLADLSVLLVGAAIWALVGWVIAGRLR